MGPAALALFLEARAAWLLPSDDDDDATAGNSSSNDDGDGRAAVAAERVQRRLGRAARTIRETVVDTYRIFLAPLSSSSSSSVSSTADAVMMVIGPEEEGEGGEEGDTAVVRMLRAGLGKAQVREALTAWVAKHVQGTHALATVRWRVWVCVVMGGWMGVWMEASTRTMIDPPDKKTKHTYQHTHTHTSSQALLRNLHSAAGLAAVRESLWAETHHLPPSSLGNGGDAPTQAAAAAAAAGEEWQQACHVGLALDRLRALLLKPPAGQPEAVPIPLALLPPCGAGEEGRGSVVAGRFMCMRAN